MKSLDTKHKTLGYGVYFGRRSRMVRKFQEYLNPHWSINTFTLESDIHGLEVVLMSLMRMKIFARIGFAQIHTGCAVIGHSVYTRLKS